MDFRRRKMIAPYDDSDENSVVVSDVNSPSQNLMSLANPQQSNDMSSPILAQLASLLQNPPNEADYQPNKKTRFLAALGSLGTRPEESMMFQNEVLHGPYERAKQGYYQKAKSLEGAAGIEERNLNVKRQMKYGEERLAQLDEQNRIRQQDADIRYQKEKDIHDTAIQKIQDKAEQTQKALEEKQRQFDAKQGNFQDQLEIKKQVADLMEQRMNLQKQMHDATLAETTRQHNAQQAKMQADIDAAKKRAEIAEEALKQREAPKVTTSTETKSPTLFQRVLGQTPESKTKTTVTQQGRSQENKVPEGAKPGGKWITLPSGKQVYQEP